ncbi:serine/threonine-protein kinase [Mycoplasmopsis iners]|uniref:serine/threonine-protein kinase n=1 Tax=Mycoplasmopsis iners TaxID=76630 RepID=UPI00049851F1|nr:serine/threonine-protein kinase [Mycoplasmopsis iners]
MSLTILNNSKVYEKYKIISEIGSGGFAQVYKIQPINDQSNTFYALKYAITPKNSDHEVAKRRFAQEIKIYSKVNSDKVAKYIDSYFDENEQYIVMEFVEGYNLKDKLSEGKLLPKTAQNYAMQIAEGLLELHASDIIHRDIKSNNIMITNEKNVKIIDFGLAIDDDSQRYTQESKVVGSVYYMAPEICISNSQPTKKSDIYALGILLYEMLTGEYPFKGKDAIDTINKQKNMKLPDLTKIVDIPQAFANVVIKATAKQADKRHKSIYEFAQDLKTVYTPRRIYEPALDSKKMKKKLTFQDFINNKITLWVSLTIIILLIITTILLVVFL